MELIQRLKAETPLWFKKIRKIGICVSAAAIALLAASSIYPGFILPLVLVTPCQWIAVAGITASAVAATAKQDATATDKQDATATAKPDSSI